MDLIIISLMPALDEVVICGNCKKYPDNVMIDWKTRQSVFGKVLEENRQHFVSPKVIKRVTQTGAQPLIY